MSTNQQNENSIRLENNIIPDNNIDITPLFEQFSNHLNLQNNKSLIFSGNFGSGKTYFLETFFSSKEAQKEYFPITISPIHYCVTDNSNIFELIKYDILCQLETNGLLEQTEFSFFENINYNLSQINVNNLLNLVFSNYRNIIGDNDELDGFQRIIDIKSTLEKIIGKINLNKGTEKYKKFKTLPELPGTHLEYNFISFLINSSIESLKQNQGKKVVLIIEDFDRLDPKHIFNILNIFASHNQKTSKHKFGFDKVITVCDFQNIEKVYHHFYGDSDFKGYISKFYSIAPYYYDFRNEIEYYIRNNNFIKRKNKLYNLFVFILSELIQNKTINIRDLIVFNELHNFDKEHEHFLFVQEHFIIDSSLIIDLREFTLFSIFTDEKLSFSELMNFNFNDNSQDELELIQLLFCSFLEDEKNLVSQLGFDDNRISSEEIELTENSELVDLCKAEFGSEPKMLTKCKMTVEMELIQNKVQIDISYIEIYLNNRFRYYIYDYKESKDKNILTGDIVDIIFNHSINIGVNYGLIDRL